MQLKFAYWEYFARKGGASVLSLSIFQISKSGGIYHPTPMQSLVVRVALIAVVDLQLDTNCLAVLYVLFELFSIIVSTIEHHCP